MKVEICRRTAAVTLRYLRVIVQELNRSLCITFPFLFARQCICCSVDERQINL